MPRVCIIRCSVFVLFIPFLRRSVYSLLAAQTAIQKDGRWLKGYHRKACAHQAMGERGIALETYRHALEIEPKNK